MKLMTDEEVFGSAAHVMSDEEVFGAAEPVTSKVQPGVLSPPPAPEPKVAEAAPAPPAAQPEPSVMSDEEVFGKMPTVPEPAAPAIPTAVTPAAPEAPGGPSAIPRGFVTGLIKSNPEAAAEALEGAAQMAPESFGATLRSGAEYMRGVAKLNPAEYETRSKGLWNIGGMSDALTWAGETLGQGVASSLPSIATGGAGALAGAAVAGPPGAVVGGLGGATIPSAALNYGEVYKALKDEGVSPADAAKYAAYATPLIAGLDVASLGSVVGKVGLGAVKNEVTRSVAKRIALGIASGAGTEGITEATQEGIKDATVSLASGKPFFTAETAKGIIEAGAGGAIVGGALGGAASAIEPAVRAANIGGAPEVAPREADIAKALAAINPPQEVRVTTVEDDVKVTKTVHGGAYELYEEGGVPRLRLRQPEGVTPAVEAGIELSTAAMRGEVAVPIEESQVAPQHPGLYSRLRAWVQERGPLNAPAARWISQMKAGDFTKEEAIDLQIPDFLAGAQGTISKDDMLNYIDARTAPLMEVTRAPLTPEEKKAQQFRIQGDIAAVMNADRSARMLNDAGQWVYDPEHPQISALLDEHIGLEQNRQWAQYEQYTTPGPRESYNELTMYVPSRNIPQRAEVVHDPAGDKKFPYAVLVDGMEYNRFKDKKFADAEIAEALRDSKPLLRTDYAGGHYDEPNDVVTFRVTVRRTADGHPIAVLEELQSDMHQEGKKRGYRAHSDQEFMAGMNRRIFDAKVSPYRGHGLVTNSEAKGNMWRMLQLDLVTPEESERYIAEIEKANSGKVPDAPFKDAWINLGVTRFLMWAAENGIRHVAWANSEEQMRRYPGGSVEETIARNRGMRAFYDEKLPGAMRKWAKKLGGVVGETLIPGEAYDVYQFGQRTNVFGNVIPSWGVFAVGSAHPIITSEDRVYAEEYAQANTVHSRYQSLVLPESALAKIEKGMPTYASAVVPPAEGAVIDGSKAKGMTVAAVQPLVDALNTLIKKLDLGVGVTVIVHEKAIVTDEPDPHTPGKFIKRMWPNTLGTAQRFNLAGQLSRGEIRIAAGMHKTAEEIWATMVHELGHIVMHSSYAKAPASLRTAMRAAFDKFKNETNPDADVHATLKRRDNAVVTYRNTRGFTPQGMKLSDMSSKDREYWMHFDEWFAEQVARWGTSSVRPLTIVEKFFSNLGKKINSILKAAADMFKLPYRAEPALEAWLDSFLDSAMPFTEDVAVDTEHETTVGNGPKMGPGEGPVEKQPETLAPKGAIDDLFNGRPPIEVQTAAAYADKFNKAYKWGLGIHQVAQRNPHIQPLQEYTETVAVAQLTKQQVMIRAQEVLKLWNKLGGKQADAVAALLDDVQNMDYRTAAEVKAKVARQPTQQELQVLATQHGVSQAGLAVFGQIATTFQEHLVRYEAVLRSEANKIANPQENSLRHLAITRQMRELRSRPYFPAMRFGDYSITIRNAAGAVTHFETFETQRRRNAAAKEIAKTLPPDDKMQLGKLDRQVRPLLGVPTQLLDMMGEKLNLSKVQRDALDQLKFELSPAQSFRHRFQHKKKIAGYSMDFRRAYANYFFHGANHLMKTMYADRLRGLAKMTRTVVKDAPNITKREEIVAYMNDHLENWLDPKSDWAAIRSLAFLWALAFSPAAAAQNMTQTVMTSYPFLASQFGDRRAVGALMRAGRKFENFYRKGSYEHATQFHQRAIWQGMQDGIIKETQAPELAGYAEGNTLGIGFGGNAVQRSWMKFNEAGAFMFELAEQVNRRLVFRAALDLALANPNAKYVKDMVVKHKLHYDQLRSEGWTEAEANAYVVARDATITTQFQYGREYAPRFMRGKARAFFVFKTFIQNYVVFLMNYPQAAIRSMLIMAFIGGLMAIPGAEDLKEILRMLGWRLFGKDFKLDHEARKLVIEILGTDGNGREVADLMLHGISRKGYGIPAMMDMLAGTVGIDVRLPTFDRSRAVSGGTLFPLEMGKIWGPPIQSPEKVIADQAQKASGAVFGAGFNIYKALTDTQLDWNDSKRWEKAVPRALASVGRAFRVGFEGGERTRTGSQLVKYDVRDPEQLMEVIGMAAGYTPYRQNLEWEIILAKNDAVKLWDIRREGLMKQMGNAVLGGDTKEVDRVREAIRNFNHGLPAEARSKAITSETLKRSIGARARTRAAQEAGVSVKKTDIPVMRAEEALYPESQRELRRVPRGLTP